MRSTRYSPIAATSSGFARPNRAKPVVSMDELTDRSVAAFYGQPEQSGSHHSRRDEVELSAERRSGEDRRSQSRREDRQNVWLDTRSGQDRRRQARRGDDSVQVVSLKI